MGPDSVVSRCSLLCGWERRGSSRPSLASVAETGDVQLVPDGRGGVTLVVDGTPQSHVDPADPLLLVFDYVQHLAAALDLLPAGPIAVTHVGGAAMTLPRYVQATRTGSTQVVLEPDASLTALVRRELPLPRGHRIRVRPVPGREGVAALGSGSADAVVVDAYAGGRVPADLTTLESLTDCARVLRPDGIIAVNLADEPGLRYAVRVLAGVRQVFPHLALVAPTEVVKGRRFGNIVVVASRKALHHNELRRRAAGLPFPTTVLDGLELDRRVRTARCFTDDDASPSPVPPPVDGWRLR